MSSHWCHLLAVIHETSRSACCVSFLLTCFTALVSAIGRVRYMCGAGGSGGEGEGGRLSFETVAGRRLDGREGGRAGPGPVVVFTGSVWRGGVGAGAGGSRSLGSGLGLFTVRESECASVRLSSPMKKV